MTAPDNITSYRPDIDGLRAVAVLAVILYHFNPGWLPGGFTGVDIFFVISGYFIIRIILNEMAAGTFSLVDFWERRVRRIIPAMVVVLTVVSACAYYFLLIPRDLADYGRSLMAQSTLVSNWWFMQQSSYFAAPDSNIPLLHTWSLYLEAQFYLLFPLLALLLYSTVKKRLGLVMIGLAVASFVYGVFLVYVNPEYPFSIPLLPHLWGAATNSSAGFYFIASRFWELLVGGIIAAYALEIRNRQLAEVVALVGLGAIGAGLWFLSDATPFPGVAALLPVMGTAAVIVANIKHQTLARRVLSFPVLVYIGLISYSLYLWHWPLLVFARYQLIPPETLTLQNQVLLLIAIFILSVVTYHFVETPVRKKRFLAGRENLFVAAFLSMVTLFAAGFVFVGTNGFPDRVPPSARFMAASMSDLNPRQAECFTRTKIGASFDKPCLLGMQDPSKVDFVVWGDCHANIDIPAFDEFGRRTNRTGIFFGAPACQPFLTDKPITKDPICIDQLKQVAAYMQAHPTVELYIVSEWERAYKYIDYTEGSDRFSILAPLLYETLAKLPREAKITILERTQTFTETTFRSVFFKIVNGEDMPMSMPRHMWEGSLESFNRGVVEAAAQFQNVRVLKPTDTFCKGNACYIADDKGFFYADDSHLSVYGVMTNILPLLLKAQTQSAN